MAVTIASLGGTETILGTPATTTLATKGITAGANIKISSTSSAVTIASPTPACRIINTSPSALTNGSSSTLTFNTNIYDPTGMHSTSVNTERVTIATTGIYHIDFCMQYVSTGAPNGPMYFSVYRNTSGVDTGIAAYGPVSYWTNSVTLIASFSTTALLTAGDYIYATWANATGVTQTPNYLNEFYPVMSVIYVGSN